MNVDRSNAGTARDVRAKQESALRRLRQQAVDMTTPPTGTGLRHVTAGVEDAAAHLLTEADVAATNIDGLTTRPSMRSLGTGSQQAAAGDHTHAAADVVSGQFAMARLASGAPTGLKFVRDDGTLAVPAGGGSVPTGDGFRHITGGVEDAAAILVTNADVDDAAQIKITKLQDSADESVLMGRGEGGGSGSWETILLGAGLTMAGNELSAAAGGSVTISEVSIPFTDGDTLRRVTVTDASVIATSKIVGSIRRPDTADDSADPGYLYITNVVRVAAGAFDLLVACLGWGFDDPVEKPPSETVKFQYTVA